MTTLYNAQYYRIAGYTVWFPQYTLISVGPPCTYLVQSKYLYFLALHRSSALRKRRPYVKADIIKASPLNCTEPTIPILIKVPYSGVYFEVHSTHGACCQ